MNGRHRNPASAGTANRKPCQVRSTSRRCGGRTWSTRYGQAMNRTDHAAAITRYASATYASVGSSSSGLALERFTAFLLQVFVSIRCGIKGGEFEQRAEQNGLVDRAQAGFDHHAAELNFLVRVALALGGCHSLKRRRHSAVLAPQAAEPTGSPLSRVRRGEIAPPAPRTPS